MSSGNPSDGNNSPAPARRLFITDLDGTLFGSDRTMSDRDRGTLSMLKAKGIIRVIATGRSLYSFQRADGLAFPIDYVIFSTGAGILRVSDKKLLRGVNLDTDAVSRVTDVLKQAALDFMIHRPVPENHRFAYWGSIEKNPDFARRITLYREVCWPLDGREDAFGPAAQLLAVLPVSGDIRIIECLQEKLPDLNVIRTTSPLDNGSTWIEFFHRNASKSGAAEWLAHHLGVSRNDTLSIGNDYNDQDLLEWSAQSFVVENAPDALKKRFSTVASHNHGGVTEAVEKWLSADETTADTLS